MLSEKAVEIVREKVGGEKVQVPSLHLLRTGLRHRCHTGLCRAIWPAVPVLHVWHQSLD